MRRLLAEVRRTLRERRTALLAVAAIIVVGETLAFLVLGDALSIHEADFLPAAAALAAGLAVALDLFGRDLRSGAHALALRTPGAHARTVSARLAALALALAGALLLEAATRAALSAALGPPRDWEWQVAGWVNGEPVRTRRPLEPVFLRGVPAAAAWAAAAVVLSFWLALGSSWTRRRPPAALLGLVPLVAGAALSGSIVDGHDADGMFPALPVDVWAGAAGAVLVAALALAWAWRRGRDTLASGASCVLRAFLVLAVVAGAGSVALAAASARWVDLRPGDADLRIGSAFLTTGGDVALDAGRGWSHFLGSTRDGESARRWSRPHVWVVDLAAGTRRDLGIGRQVTPPLGERWTLDAQPFLVVRRDREAWSFTEGDRVEWLDGSTGEMRLHEDPTAEPPVTVPAAWRRASRRANSLVRDATGRLAWIHDDRVQREGEAEVDDAPGPIRPAPWTMLPAPGGWFGPWTGTSGDPSGYLFLDATTGERVPAPLPEHAVAPQALGRTHVLFGAREPRSAGTGRRPPTWRLWSVADHAERVVGDGIPYRANAPVVAEGVVLVAVPRDAAAPHGELALALWRPETEERRPVRVDGALPSGWRDVNVEGRSSDGTFLLRVRTLEENVVEIGKDAPPRDRHALVRFDPAEGVATVLAADARVRDLRPFALEPGGSLLVVEDERRIVRLGPAPGAREVVFPR